MNKVEFVKIIAPVAEYYGRTLTDAAIAVYYDAAQEIDADVFEYLVRAHIADPDQGKFFPTLSHLYDQAGTEADIARKANIDFHDNPAIDGTSTFDLNHESSFRRYERGRIYVKQQIQKFQSSTPAERLNQSTLIPLPLKQKALAVEGLTHG